MDFESWLMDFESWLMVKHGLVLTGILLARPGGEALTGLPRLLHLKAHVPPSFV